MISDETISILTSAAPAIQAATARLASPGPWTASEENCGNGLNVVDGKGNRVLHSAVVWRGHEIVNAKQAAANARLAAAAPRMLEALRVLAVASGAAFSPAAYQKQVQQIAIEAIAEL